MKSLSSVQLFLDSENDLVIFTGLRTCKHIFFSEIKFSDALIPYIQNQKKYILFSRFQLSFYFWEFCIPFSDYSW